MAQQQFTTIGAITGVHGIKGWVKLRSWTRPMSNIFDYQPWWLTRSRFSAAAAPQDAQYRHEDLQQVELQRQCIRDERMLAKLTQCDSREQADLLVGKQVVVDCSLLPAAADNEYYWSDLIGLTVHTIDGVSLGVVSGLLETGANDVLVVHGERERLLPFIQGQVVRQVSLQHKTMLVDWDKDF